MKNQTYCISIITAMLSLLTICDKFSFPTPPADKKNTLVIGDTLAVAFHDTLFNYDRHLWLSFDELVEDSRCPVNVMCFWEGNAKISMTFAHALKKAKFRLDTYKGFTPDTTLFDYKISLIDLQPMPHTDSTYTVEDYRAFIYIAKN